MKKLEETAAPDVKKTGQEVVSSDTWADCKIWAKNKDDGRFSHPKKSNLSAAPEKNI